MIHSMGSTSVRSASIAEFAADCPLRTPMCYFGGVEMESGASLPLLEDLSWVRNLKSAGGCVDDAELVIREIGRLHAALVGRCSPRQDPVAPDEGQMTPHEAPLVPPIGSAFWTSSASGDRRAGLG